MKKANLTLVYHSLLQRVLKLLHLTIINILRIILIIIYPLHHLPPPPPPPPPPLPLPLPLPLLLLPTIMNYQGHI